MIPKLHKKIIFPILVILVLLILGCTKSDSKTKEIDVFIGTEGLTAEFAKTAPPPRVFEDSKFPILLRIRNKGAYSIVKGENDGGKSAVLSIGREKDYVPLLSFETDSRVFASKDKDRDNEALFYVDGKTPLNPKGDEMLIAANAGTGKLDPQSEHRQSTITATLCYPYKTVLSTTICIDPDVAGIRQGKKVCNVKELAFKNGQGAPIVVTKIEPQMIPEGDKNIRPQFMIFIENSGNGNPVNINSYQNACGKSDVDKKDMWNVAFIRAYTSGQQTESQLECTPSLKSSNAGSDENTGFIRFRDKKDFVRCTFRDVVSRSSDAYTSPLKVEIDYGYVQTIAATFIIQKPLKY